MTTTTKTSKSVQQVGRKLAEDIRFKLDELEQYDIVREAERCNAEGVYLALAIRKDWAKCSAKGLKQLARTLARLIALEHVLSDDPTLAEKRLHTTIVRGTARPEYGSRMSYKHMWDATHEPLRAVYENNADLRALAKADALYTRPLA